MSYEPAPGFRRSSARLLAELMAGAPDLPPARERWVALLTHRSPDVRLAAEVALVELVREVASAERTERLGSAPADAPRRVPQFGVHEPKRHCLNCFGHDFWIDAAGRLHCEACEPLKIV